VTTALVAGLFATIIPVQNPSHEPWLHCFTKIFGDVPTPPLGSARRLQYPCLTTEPLPGPARKTRASSPLGRLTHALPAGEWLMAKETILVVDDSPTDLRLVTSLLESKGYMVITANDGEEALEKASRQRPHLMVLDILLPKKNGFQVCRQLKESPETKSIKILMLTAKVQESDRYWGLKQGADVYIKKPFEDEDFLRSIDQLI
jgi:twitching motility two-component system response regulator PilH